ncbi:MAG TPA: hypothetical protein VKD00_00285 [Methyloceanibacter sp.]|nr:hypothetical protein [Methyloceanibacter sp.]
MRKAKFTVIAGAIAAFAAVLGFSGPVEAGTCQPVNAKGNGKDIAMANDAGATRSRGEGRSASRHGYADLDQLRAGTHESRLQDIGGGRPEIDRANRLPSESRLPKA